MTDEQLDTLIAGLQEYADDGVIDPWVLDDGSVIQPLDALKELKTYRTKYGRTN